MDEKLKHRLIGLAVIISLFIIVIPFFIKKNQPDLTDLATLNIEQPTAAPTKPDLAMEPVTIDFAAAQVAQVDVNSTPARAKPAPTPTMVASVPTKKIKPERETLPIYQEEETMLPSDVDPDYIPGEIMPIEPMQLGPVAPESADEPMPTDPGISPQRVNEELSSDARPKPQGEWIVQLGSFANRTNADALLAKLQKQGFNAFIESTANSQGSRINRILVGPQVNKQQAQQTAQALEQAVQLKGIVIKWNG
jgi:DedD protein